MQNKIIHQFDLNGVPFKIESGEIGFHAQSSMMVTYGETSVYVTVTIGKDDPNLDFFPLSVDYVEKLYAAGRISSSPYIKREGKPTDQEILNGRLIDHAIRSLFHKDFKCETQVIAQVFSYDKLHDPVLASIIGVSFALSYSGLPFLGPYGATKIGYIDGEIKINPSLEEMQNSSLDMFVSSLGDGIVSVEAEAHDVSDEIIKESIKIAIKNNELLIDEQNNFIEKYGKKDFEYIVDDSKKIIFDEINKVLFEKYYADLEEGIYSKEKSSRLDIIRRTKESLNQDFKVQIESGLITETDIFNLVEKQNKKIVRKNILESEKRPDGRGINEIRPISMRTGVLPRVHGSALFTRGETQTLSIVTLGTQRDALNLQNLNGDLEKRYFHHYNMPGYVNGEVDRKFGFPNRRAIGHGAIGEKALVHVLPSADDFPYTIRVVSEVVSSNGSTSMAATCSSSLALMDAGVNIKTPIGGIGVGLIYENDSNYKILTDIIGMEDFYGDMDFKITGSANGITAIQLDNKMSGIPLNILLEAIDKSKEGRLYVLETMSNCMDKPSSEISIYAPQVKTLQIKPEKIGELIGPGGKTIRSITEKTGVEINIEDDGRVSVYSDDKFKFDQAIKLITGLVQDLEEGMEFQATITRIETYGAFIEVPDTKIQGMIHVSNFGVGRIEDLNTIVKVGEVLTVKYLGKDEKGRTKFAAKLDKKEESV